MEKDSSNLNAQRDLIAEKFRDTEALTKVVKQAVSEAVDKAQRLGFLPPPSKIKPPSK
ncbi:MAG: hypothetical protein NVSMB40_19640 [Aquirhabdus sp.]